MRFPRRYKSNKALLKMTQHVKGKLLPHSIYPTARTSSPSVAQPKINARRIRKDAAARNETISQILLIAALIAILVVGSGLTTGTPAFIMLLSCIGVGIFLVRRSLASPPSSPY